MPLVKIYSLSSENYSCTLTGIRDAVIDEDVREIEIVIEKGGEVREIDALLYDTEGDNSQEIDWNGRITYRIVKNEYTEIFYRLENIRRNHPSKIQEEIEKIVMLCKKKGIGECTNRHGYHISYKPLVFRMYCHLPGRKKREIEINEESILKASLIDLT